MARPRRDRRGVRGGACTRRPGRGGRLRAASDHPDRLSILCELVRVDLEHQWARQQTCWLEDYRTAFPEVFDDPELLHAMAYEEFRLRQQAGEHPSPDEYRRRFGLTGRDWPSEMAPSHGTAPPPPTRPAVRSAGRWELVLDPRQVEDEQAELLRSLDRTDPHAAERLAEAVDSVAAGRQ